jgi:hypothetical protein
LPYSGDVFAIKFSYGIISHSRPFVWMISGGYRCCLNYFTRGLMQETTLVQRLFSLAKLVLVTRYQLYHF